MRYSEQFKAGVCARVEHGEKCRDVANEVGVGYQTVWRWCQERGVSVSKGANRGPYAKREHCKYCGASESHWAKNPSLSLIDLNDVEPASLPSVSYTPCFINTRLDDDGYEWCKYNLESPEWFCSGCGYELRGDDDGGWFVTDTGECIASFCPGCGHPIKQDIELLMAEWREVGE